MTSSIIGLSDSSLLYLAALCFLLVELLLTGFGGPFLFCALAAGITGVIVQIFGPFDALVMIGIHVVAFIVIFGVLYKPLKAYQSKRSENTGSDLVGQTFIVVESIGDQGGKLQKFGMDLQAKKASPDTPDMPTGVEVEVVNVIGTTLFVKPKRVPQHE